MTVQPSQCYSLKGRDLTDSDKEKRRECGLTLGKESVMVPENKGVQSQVHVTPLH